MLQARQLTYAYTGGTAITFPDLNCEKGEQWLLLGQSGSGKTTLLHLLAGLRTPTSGMIQIGETPITKLAPSRLDRFRGQNIGIIFQQSHFVRALTVGENLALARTLAGLPPNPSLISDLLKQLNILHKLDARPNALSVGEQQRVAIARALVNEPLIIFADEPTSALDDENADKVINLLKESVNAAGATLLIVTHDQRLKDQFVKKVELNF
ncbi:MAG: ABC transporter ATP-binding protein [Saprospiraceae bacterium]|nr:ABC transporter ATP-binding protein [Saprospiraceae bacterium]